MTNKEKYIKSRLQHNQINDDDIDANDLWAAIEQELGVAEKPKKTPWKKLFALVLVVLFIGSIYIVHKNNYLGFVVNENKITVASDKLKSENKQQQELTNEILNLDENLNQKNDHGSSSLQKNKVETSNIKAGAVTKKNKYNKKIKSTTDDLKEMPGREAQKENDFSQLKATSNHSHGDKNETFVQNQTTSFSKINLSNDKEKLFPPKDIHLPGPKYKVLTSKGEEEVLRKEGHNEIRTPETELHSNKHLTQNLPNNQKKSILVKDIDLSKPEDKIITTINDFVEEAQGRNVGEEIPPSQINTINPVRNQNVTFIKSKTAFLSIKNSHHNQLKLLPPKAFHLSVPEDKTLSINKLEIALFGGINALLFDYGAFNQSNYAKLLKESTSISNGNSIGINLSYIRQRFMLSLGAESHRLYTEFNAREVNHQNRVIKNHLIRAWVNPENGTTLDEEYGDVEVKDSIIRTVKHFNNYKRLSLPLSLGLRFKNKSISLDLLAGFSLGRTLRNQGRYISEESKISNFEESSYFSLGFHVDPRLSLNIGKQFFILLNPKWTYGNVMNYTTDSTENKSHQLNFNVGFGYKLK